jgi:1-phosphatidylinositol phosphodiesterase
MGTLKLRNCTIWDVHYWRKGGNSKAVVKPGQEGTYDWGATYTLGVKRENVTPDGLHRRSAVNQNGIYYVVWRNSNQELDILTEAEASVYPISPDNKYLSNWFSSNAQWMSPLDGTLTLDKFSIPGTHDSGTEKVDAGYSKTQNFGINKQLQDGIRYLDIRVETQKNSGDPLKVMHSGTSCKISFGDVLTACSNFLKDNKQETIIMLMNAADGKSTDIEAAFKTYLHQNQYNGLFYLNNTIPTLDKARGHIVLFRRFVVTDNATMGIDLSSGWLDNATFELTTPNGIKFEIEDQYKEHDTNKKEKIVQNCLASAMMNPKDGKMHLTYNSIATNGFHTPYQYAWGSNGVDPAMNVCLTPYLTKNSGNKRFGVIMFDFYNNLGSDNDNVNLIIKSNNGLKKTTD